MHLATGRSSAVEVANLAASKLTSCPRPVLCRYVHVTPLYQYFPTHRPTVVSSDAQFRSELQIDILVPTKWTRMIWLLHTFPYLNIILKIYWNVLLRKLIALHRPPRWTRTCSDLWIAIQSDVLPVAPYSGMINVSQHSTGDYCLRTTMTSAMTCASRSRSAIDTSRSSK